MKAILSLILLSAANCPASGFELGSMRAGDPAFSAAGAAMFAPVPAKATGNLEDDMPHGAIPGAARAVFGKLRANSQGAAVESYGVGVGWLIKGAARPIDYERAWRDEEYAAGLADKYYEKTVNVLYDSAGRVLAEFSGVEGMACFPGVPRIECSVRFDPGSGLAVFVQNGKWETVNAAAVSLRLSDSDPVKAASNITASLRKAYYGALDSDYRQDKAYLRDREALAFTFRLDEVVGMGYSVFFHTISSAGVPKAEDGFYDSRRLPFRLVRRGQGLQVVVN